MTDLYLEKTLHAYLDELSSDTAIPGGGGTSALVAALGISLALMVARIAGRKLEGDKKAQIEKIIGLLEKMRHDSQQIIDVDPKVYREVMDSYKHSKNEKDPKKAEKIVEDALSNSFRLQADLALLAIMAKELLPEVGSFAKGSIRNDLIVSSALLDGAFRGAAATAKISVVYMKDGPNKKHLEEALQKLETRFQTVQFA